MKQILPTFSPSPWYEANEGKHWKQMSLIFAYDWENLCFNEIFKNIQILFKLSYQW